MNKFRKKSKTTEEIPTASLPDIIFMLLFFFMVATVIRSEELLVKQELPLATQLKKVEQKSLITYFHIGSPKNSERFGLEPRIQFNDVFVTKDDILNCIGGAVNRLPEMEKEKLTVSLKVDEEVKMGIVTDLEEKLKEANTRKVMYNTGKKENTF